MRRASSGRWSPMGCARTAPGLGGACERRRRLVQDRSGARHGCLAKDRAPALQGAAPSPDCNPVVSQRRTCSTFDNCTMAVSTFQLSLNGLRGMPQRLGRPRCNIALSGPNLAPATDGWWLPDAARGLKNPALLTDLLAAFFGSCGGIRDADILWNAGIKPVCRRLGWYSTLQSGTEAGQAPSASRSHWRYDRVARTERDRACSIRAGREA